MKMSYMIVGMEIEAYNMTGNMMMRLTLQSLTNVKEKNIKERIMSNPLSLIDNIREKKQEEYRPVVYVNCLDCYPWKEVGYKIGRHVTLELDFDDSTGGIDT